MRDYITIGATPCEEPCAQVGADNYREQSMKECIAFKKQLRRQFGEEPEGAQIVTKSFPHDFGTYHEVCVVFEDENEVAVNYAFGVENSTPANWDEEARKELGLD
jgi:hypothetical protein